MVSREPDRVRTSPSDGDGATLQAAPPLARSPIVRAAWFCGGWLAVTVGGIGVVVPGLPTTVFMILAAACFARSSPRFERWVLNLPGVGRAVSDHRAGLGMPRRAKRAAVSMMAVAIAISVVVTDNRTLQAGIVAAGVVGAWYIIRRVPTAPPARATDASSSAAT